jgi:mono/diheme cytochrome c family protein
MKSLTPIFLVAMLFSQMLGAEGGPSAAEAGFQRCAACHLASGEGVPGAFPPLTGRIAKMAATTEGRSYLIAVVNTGLMGSITVDGVPYMGVMPAQGNSYDANGIRDVLNYSVQVLDGDNMQPQWQPFTHEEVQAVIEARPPTSGMENGRLRQDLIAKYPGLE